MSTRRPHADYLEDLSRVNVRRLALEREIAVCVSAARAAGIPWEAIGEALGVSKQAVQKRYGRRGAANSPVRVVRSPSAPSNGPSA